MVGSFITPPTGVSCGYRPIQKLLPMVACRGTGDSRILIVGKVKAILVHIIPILIPAAERGWCWQPWSVVRAWWTTWDRKPNPGQTNADRNERHPVVPWTVELWYWYPGAAEFHLPPEPSHRRPRLLIPSAHLMHFIAGWWLAIIIQPAGSSLETLNPYPFGYRGDKTLSGTIHGKPRPVGRFMSHPSSTCLERGSEEDPVPRDPKPTARRSWMGKKDSGTFSFRGQVYLCCHAAAAWICVTGHNRKRSYRAQKRKSMQKNSNQY